MSLLAFFESKRYPQIPAGLDLEIGWWVFIIAVAVVVWGWSRAPWLRRVLFVHEDPRIFALFRVMLASFTFACFWNLEPYWRFLWSDEGMFTLTEAQARLGRSALSGWTAEDGFLDSWAVVKFFWTKPSLWFLHGSPAYVYGTMWVFFGLLFAYAIGFRTRVTGVLCWLMLNSIYARNAFYLEGTDTVYRVLWFYALFMRADRAWSVDNAIRVWRERRAAAKLGASGEARGNLVFDDGLVLDRLTSVAWAGFWGWMLVVQLDMHFDAPWAMGLLALSVVIFEGWWSARRARDEHARFGPQPVQRYVGAPRWPRVLIMIQYALLYCNTGAVKTGVVWMRGDALYYALNLDHFYRFEGFTQWMSAYLGTNFFRLASWVTHFWEIGFPLLLVGMWLGFRYRYAEADWALAAQRRWRHRAGSLALVLVWVAMGVAMIKSLPFLFPLNDKGAETMPAFVVQTFTWVWFAGLPVLLAALWGLARWSPTIPGWSLGRLRCPPITIDRDFLRAWLLGRRTWLTLGLIFHGFLIAFMNIGMFPFIMIGGYLAFTSARPWLTSLRWLHTRWLGRRGDPNSRRHTGVRAAFAPREPGAQIDARNVGRRGGEFVPDAWVIAFAGALLGLIAARGQAPASWVSMLGQSLGQSETHLVTWPGSVALLVASLAVALRILGPNDMRGRAWLGPVAGLATATGLVLLGVAWSEAHSELVPSEFKAALGRGVHVLLLVAFVTALAYGWRRRTRPAEPEPVGGSSPGRAIVFCFCLWHLGAVSAVLYPNYPIWGTWHSASRRVFGGYLRGTHTNQSWKMFAPNPPRANSFSRTVLVDHEGTHWDLHNNSYLTRSPIFWANDRMRKMQRRLIGKGKWYIRYWANFHCREWALATGETPQEVQVYKINTRIPNPNKSKWRPWSPRKTKVTTTFVQKHKCGGQGELTPEMKQRRGLPLTEADQEKIDKARQKAERESKTRREAWARRRDYGGKGAPAKAGFVAKDDSRAAKTAKPDKSARAAPP